MCLLSDVHSRNEGRNGKITRQIFTIDNTASTQNHLADKTKQLANNNTDKTAVAPVLSSSDKAAKMELEAILRRPAHSAEEKYVVHSNQPFYISQCTHTNF